MARRQCLEAFKLSLCEVGGGLPFFYPLPGFIAREPGDHLSFRHWSSLADIKPFNTARAFKR